MRDSLAVAGHDRHARAPALGYRSTLRRVRAKTGTTNIASALSGYVGTRYAFVVVQNGSPVATWSAREAQDRFVQALAGLTAKR